MKIGGRGQRRVERVDLESFITATKQDTATWVTEHPFIGTDDEEAAGLSFAGQVPRLRPAACQVIDQRSPRQVRPPGAQRGYNVQIFAGELVRVTAWSLRVCGNRPALCHLATVST